MALVPLFGALTFAVSVCSGADAMTAASVVAAVLALVKCDGGQTT